jgi:hypothetical protein
MRLKDRCERAIQILEIGGPRGPGTSGDTGIGGEREKKK